MSIYMFTYWNETFALPNFLHGKQGNTQRFNNHYFHKFKVQE